MPDFETHPRGTHAEVVASRALAREIEQMVEQYGNVFPQNVIRAYNNLNEIYKKQLEGQYE